MRRAFLTATAIAAVALPSTDSAAQAMDDDFSHPRLTLIFQEMGAPHFGEKFEIRVTDQEDGREVGRHTVGAIDQNDIEVWLNTIVVGHSYTIDFYADHNDNGRYDAPPTDHAWRLTLEPAVGNDTVTFVHNINFTDIEWPPLIDFVLYEAIWKGLAVTAGGNPVELSATASVDAESRTLTGVLEASGVLGFVDLLQLYFDGEFSAEADTGSVTVTDAPPGKRNANNWSGTVNYSNSGRVTSDIDFDVMGFSGSFSFEGTVGKTQAIASYSIEPLGFAGTAIMREDSVLTKSLVSAESDELPDLRGHLAQNYPNPFRPTTHIPFTMPEAGAVEIAVFDLLGRRVATLLDGFRNAGEHTVPFNGSDLSTGIYSYRLEARFASGERISETKRMAIVR